MWRRSAVASGLNLVLILLQSLTPEAQSLASLAQAEAERRSTIRQPSKIYTNADLNHQRTRDVSFSKPDPSTVIGLNTGLKESPREAIEHLLRNCMTPCTVSTVAPAARPCLSTDWSHCIDTMATRSLADIARRTDVVKRGSNLPSGEVIVSALPNSASFADAAHTIIAAALPAAETRTPAAMSFTGWSNFTLPKTREEIAADLRLEGREIKNIATVDRAKISLPPQHQLMRSTVGLGYVQGADWAADINSGGKISGLNADLSTFLTMGQNGLNVLTGRFSLADPDSGWGLEAGHLFTDLRGLSRGVRASWRFARFHPTLSFYDGDDRRQQLSTIAYREEFQPSRNVVMGGEVASDGSLFVRAQSVVSRLGLDTYYRRQSANVAAHDQGVGATYRSWNGITVRASVRKSVTSPTEMASDQWRLLAVTVPFSRGANLTVERDWLSNDVSDSAGTALIFHIPAGPLRVFQRYQWGDVLYKRREVPVGVDQRQMQTVTAYRPLRWLELNYQIATQWFEDGRARQWDELRSVWRLAPKTTLETVTAMPDVLEPSRLRLRFSQQLTSQLALIAEYGRISAFRQGPAFDTERSRFAITLRKQLSTSTPARGGTVSGTVLEPQGYPVPATAVRLGPYRTVTDERGRYVFRNMPAGEFELTLDKDLLPADYAAGNTQHVLTISRSTQETIDLRVVPLGSLTGHVYCDLNRNGRLDRGEEISGVILRLEHAATTSDQTGLYGFYNLAPGTYAVALDTRSLPEGYAAPHPSVTVVLDADRAVTGQDFVLAKTDKPIIIQELR